MQGSGMALHWAWDCGSMAYLWRLPTYLRPLRRRLRMPWRAQLPTYLSSMQCPTQGSGMGLGMRSRLRRLP